MEDDEYALMQLIGDSIDPMAGETDHPRIDTIGMIADALGVTMHDIFADANVVVATESLVEIKETAEVVEAERDVMTFKNEVLEAKVAALTMELELLKNELQHKKELLAVHEQYLTIINRNIRESSATLLSE